MSRTPGQVWGAAIVGGCIGGLGGWAVASAVGASSPTGTTVGLVAYAMLAGWADASREPGRPQPIVVRIAMAGAIAAAFGGLAEMLLPTWSAVVPAAIAGAVTGAVGFRPGKVVLGAVVGAAMGVGFDVLGPGIGWAVPTALTVVVYRTIAAIVWHGREQVRVVGEQVPAELLAYVVPLRETSGYVGVDFLERYAASMGATFAHEPADVGIVDDFDSLGSPIFDPGLVHPLVREFYEHTSRFTLVIVPEWRWWMRLPYLAFRTTIAAPIGQANAPFDQREVQRGVRSWIDTVDVDGDGIVDLRAWVRAYETGEPVYVGIYTVRPIDGIPHVSVGFPIPSGSFTATLFPSNHRGDGLILRSHGGTEHAGHYLSLIDDDGNLTTVQLTTFGEEIDVFVDEGTLRTEHSFTLDDRTFMTLHYTISRKQVAGSR